MSSESQAQVLFVYPLSISDREFQCLLAEHGPRSAAIGRTQDLRHSFPCTNRPRPLNDILIPVTNLNS